jgi:hypothetical protein
VRQPHCPAEIKKSDCWQEVQKVAVRQFAQRPVQLRQVRVVVSPY